MTGKQLLDALNQNPDLLDAQVVTLDPESMCSCFEAKRLYVAMASTQNTLYEHTIFPVPEDRHLVLVID